MSIAIFKEEQKLNRGWIWFIAIISTTAMMILAINVFQDGLQAAATEDLIASIFVFLLLSAIVMMMGAMKLEVVVDKYSIKYRFLPFLVNWKKLYKEDIEVAEIIRLRGLKYGNRGYHLSGKTKTMNMGSKFALKIQLRNKKRKLVISTRKPKEFEVAIETMLNKAVED